MSSETIRILTSLDKNNINTKLAVQCSPVIAGVKNANLMVVKRKYLMHIRKMFKETPIRVFAVCFKEDTVSVLLYRKKDTEKLLEDEKVLETLGKLGCVSDNLNSLLFEIKRKYTRYCCGDEDFPHELGLILGYPPEDVEGFIENNGMHYKVNGYWKVYCDEERALEKFSIFDETRERAIKMVKSNTSLLEMMTS